MIGASHQIALWQAGIQPPLTGSTRTTCPICSPFRLKSREKCLRVHVVVGGAVKVNCKHCGYQATIEGWNGQAS